MRYTIKFCVFITVILCFSFALKATGENEAAAELYSADEFDVESIIDAIPDETAKKLPMGDIFSSEDIYESFSFEYFFTLIKNTLFSAISDSVGTLSSVMGLIIAASALSALKGVLRSDSLTVLFEFLSCICLMLMLYNSIYSLVESVRLYLTQLTGIVGAMIPVMIAIGTAGGNLSASGVSANAMMLGIAFVESLAVGGLFPVLQLSFGISIASGFGGLRLSGISKLVRGVFTWILGLISAVISAVMTFQTSIASRADSLSMRAVKFAASKAVPVVGGIASDAVSAVAGSLSLVRTTVGWVGVIIIAVLTLPVIVKIILMRLCVNISCTAADIIGLERERNLLSDMCGLLGFLAAVCVICALMFVYAAALFAKTASALM